MKEIRVKRGSYKKYLYVKGQVVDKITILEDNFILHQERYKVKFKCECGKIDYRRQDYIERMQVKTCKECSRKNKYPEQRKSRGLFIDELNVKWITYLQSSDNLIRGLSKKIECTVSLNDLRNQLIKQDYKCAYTGRKLNVLNTFKQNSNASIDRIDSKGNYSIDNIQWVLKPINIMKNNFSDDDFLQLCNEVSNHTRQF